MSATPQIEDRDLVKRILKSEMQRRGVSYRDLAERLKAAGMGDAANEANIRNMINRGGFSALFFVRACLAMGAYTVRLGEQPEA